MRPEELVQNGVLRLLRGASNVRVTRVSGRTIIRGRLSNRWTVHVVLIPPDAEIPPQREDS